MSAITVLDSRDHCGPMPAQPTVHARAVADSHVTDTDPAPSPAGPVTECDYCGRGDCAGDCDGYYDHLADDLDARYEAWRDQESD